MESMADVLEEVIPEIDDEDRKKHFACFCNIGVTLCGMPLKYGKYVGEIENDEWATCIDCYLANKDPQYKCPKCGK